MTAASGPDGPRSYAIFLRGVNVGGITVRMADLRDELATLPLTEVRTVLASGNVTCSTTLDLAELEARVEESLRRRFGYDARVFGVGREELVAIAAAVPPQPAGPTAEGGTTTTTTTGSRSGMHTYVTLFRSGADLDVFLEEARELGEQATVLPGGAALAWFSPVGRSTDVPVARLLARARYASTTTTRNITTIERVLDLLSQASAERLPGRRAP